ncbi:MAG: Holliday junction branch migration protein RuvA [Hominisplanchenecus sp.]
MIAYIRGEIADITEGSVVLDVNGIGYRVFVSGREQQVLPNNGRKVKLHTYFHVKEDGMQLYGFQSKDDLEMFSMLLGVSGIGPKAALGILSVFSADDLRFAVLSEDAKTIAKAPGIGTKTAKKLILELKDKLSLEDAFEKKLQHEGENPSKTMTDARQEAVEALTALGYSASDALRAVKQAEVTEDMDTEAILKAALKKMI